MSIEKVEMGLLKNQKQDLSSKEKGFEQSLSESDKKSFEGILDSVGMEAEYVSREEFNSRKGNFLEKDENGNENIIILPIDLKVGELPGIIKRINNLTFNDNLPNFSSSIELKSKIVSTFKELTGILKNAKNESNRKSIQKALKKYYNLYANLYPGEEKKLNNSEYIESVLRGLDSKKQKDYESKLKIRLEEIKNLEKKDKEGNLDSILGALEDDMSLELKNHLNESVFEKGVNDIRTGFELIRGEKLDEMRDLLSEGFEMSPKSNGTIVFIGENNTIIIMKGITEEDYTQLLLDVGYEQDDKEGQICFKKEGKKTIIISSGNINTSEGKKNYINGISEDGDEILINRDSLRGNSEEDMESNLREIIGVDNLKSELEGVRKTGNQEEIAKKELEVSNKIINSIYRNVNYKSSPSENTTSIKNTIDKGETLCVGFSIIGHSILSELGIKHEGLDIPGHSALSVEIGGEKYLFDATNNPELKKFQYGKDKKGEMDQMEFEDGTSIFSTSGDVERVLMSQLLGNTAKVEGSEQDLKKGLDMLNKSIELYPNAQSAYVNKLVILNNQKKYDEVIEAAKKVLKINPEIWEAIHSFGTAKYYSGDKEGALDEYEKVIGLLKKEGISSFKVEGDYNFIKKQVLREKAKSFLKKGQVDEARKEYMKIVSLDSNNPEIYYEIGEAFKSRDPIFAGTAFAETAKIYYKEGKYQLAKKIVDNVLNNLDPENKDLLKLKYEIDKKMSEIKS